MKTVASAYFLFILALSYSALAQPDALFKNLSTLSMYQLGITLEHPEDAEWNRKHGIKEFQHFKSRSKNIFSTDSVWQGTQYFNEDGKPTHSHWVLQDDVRKKVVSYEFHYYDRNGNDTQYLAYTQTTFGNQNSRVYSKYCRSAYNKNGYKISETDTVQDYHHTFQYSFYAVNKLLRTFTVDEGSTQIITEFTYNEAGQLLTLQNENLSLSFSYDSGGMIKQRCIESRKLPLSNGKISDSTLRIYSAKGLVEMTIEKNFINGMTGRILYSYNPAGHLVKMQEEYYEPGWKFKNGKASYHEYGPGGLTIKTTHYELFADKDSGNLIPMYDATDFFSYGFW